jgi:hypothetical protein
MTDVAAKITVMEEEMRQLRDLMVQVLNAVEDNKRTVTRLLTLARPSDEVTEEELFAEAYRVFGITSEPDPDDSLIAPNAVIKPIDWSDYA